MRRPLLCLALVTACSDTREVEVYLATDYTLDHLDQFQVSALAGGARADIARRRWLGMPGQRVESFAIDRPKDQDVFLTIDTFDGENAVLTASRVIRADADGDRGYVFIVERCETPANQDCPLDQVCGRCGCEDASLELYDEDDPAPWTFACPPEQADAGVDAGIADAEAGVPGAEAGVPDTGIEPDSGIEPDAGRPDRGVPPDDCRPAVEPNRSWSAPVAAATDLPLAFPRAQLFGLDPPFTLELWAKLDAVPVTGIQLLAAQDDQSMKIWALMVDTTPAVSFTISGQGSEILSIGPVMLGNATDWHHIALELDRNRFGVTARLFVDGVSGASQPANSWSRRDAAMFAPGNAALLIDSVRISTNARYGADFTPDRTLDLDADTGGLWSMDETVSSTIAYDELCLHNATVNEGTFVDQSAD
jgi:hypothetical protein